MCHCLLWRHTSPTRRDGKPCQSPLSAPTALQLFGARLRLPPNRPWSAVACHRERPAVDDQPVVEATVVCTATQRVLSSTLHELRAAIHAFTAAAPLQRRGIGGTGHRSDGLWAFRRLQ